MLKFAKFMSRPFGRTIRALGGVAIIWWGYTMGDALGYTVMAIGAIPLLAGILNLCMIASFISMPFRGEDILALPDSE